MKKYFYAALFLPLYLNAATERQVVFVHSDILGSPVTETVPESGSAPSAPTEANIIVFFNGNIRVSWSSVIGATNYKVELLKGKTCGQIIHIKTTSNLNTEFTPTSSGDYAARVSACSGGCSTSKMTSWINISSGASSAEVSCTL
ncbi:hypothetical protein ACD631_19580 [Alteromonas macleodii]|uniref:hypothetical protein n=1 Tax=Alteromonas macleodii TaxID=28108 RepID=UPI002076B8E7|nr:hypothetical protein [Alteromonas macleodii]USI28540.1 hypothetical protein NFG60_02270 [Alteromonas macleodii]